MCYSRTRCLHMMLSEQILLLLLSAAMKRGKNHLHHPNSTGVLLFSLKGRAHLSTSCLIMDVTDLTRPPVCACARVRVSECLYEIVYVWELNIEKQVQVIVRRYRRLVKLFSPETNRVSTYVYLISGCDARAIEVTWTVDRQDARASVRCLLQVLHVQC